MKRILDESAKRTDENSPAIYCWERRPTEHVQSVKRTVDAGAEVGSSGSIPSRPFHGLFISFSSCHAALKCWATFMRPLRGLTNTWCTRRLSSVFCLVLSAFCLLPTVGCRQD